MSWHYLCSFLVALIMLRRVAFDEAYPPYGRFGLLAEWLEVIRSS